MSWVGFEQTIPEFERAKTFYALDPLPLWSAIKYHDIKLQGRVVVWIHVFLSSVLDGIEWSTSLPNSITQGENVLKLPFDKRLGWPHNR
jgi:hypothetical protein